MALRPTKLFLLALLLSLAPAALASTWYVDGNNGDDANDCKSPANACGSIGHAISLTASGDTIKIAAANYQENDLAIPISLKIIGAGAATTILDGTYSSYVFIINGAAAHVAISNLTIERGNGSLSGGAIRNGGLLTLSNSVLFSNTAGSGGAIQNSGTALITNTLISKNGTGGVHTAACGAIDNRGKMTITNSTLDGNTDAPTNFTYGGAICNSGTLTINGTTLSNNGSDGLTYGAGGAIYNLSKLAVNNSTFYGNSASGGAGYGGGAIYNEGAIKISNSTFGGNMSPVGAGIDNTSGTVTLQNSILAASTNGGNCAGTLKSSGYNMSSDGTCNFTAAGDRNNTNPNLGPLQNNGGPTLTMALPSGSPAIDAGNPAGCKNTSGATLKTDQRGQPRPDKEDTGGCDMGAYESQTD